MKRVWAFSLLCLSLLGCYSNPCTIDSEPQGASVYIDGKLVGKTPVSAQIGEPKVMLKIELEGYNTDTREIVSTQDPVSGNYTTPPQVFVRLAKKEGK